MKKEHVYLFILVVIEVALILALLWFAAHSEYVTHAEFLTGLGIVITGMSGGFWTLWSYISVRISDLAEKIGYLEGRIDESKPKKARG